MTINVKNGTLSQQEQNAYVEHLLRSHPNNSLETLSISIDGDFVDLEYKFAPRSFERIRRITGYLVGTMDRWNNAKSHEEKDRIKHTI